MRRRIYLIILLMPLVGSQGCSDDPSNGSLVNQPPQVRLLMAPPEGSVTDYTVDMSWGGWDPDGTVEFFEYCITNNDGGALDPADTVGAWSRIDGNEKTFMFSADVIADSADVDGDHEAEEFRRSHTFLIRAVDDRGLRSTEPAYRSFTARTLCPVVNIILPRYNSPIPVRVPPISKFRWSAVDFVSTLHEVQPPALVRWILVGTDRFNGNWDETLEYIRSNPDAPEWSAWHDYSAPDGSGEEWTTPPTDFGAYVFAVQAKDEAGAVTPDFDPVWNVRRVLVSGSPGGPLLSVYNRYIGKMVTASLNTPTVIADLAAGLRMSFEFGASAEHYGGVITGYRYGWDIVDLNDDSQWDIDWTPFVSRSAISAPRTFFFGVHTFFVEAMDNSGFKSRVSVKLNIVPVIMDRHLLLVDDYVEGGISGWDATNGALPSDEEHDAFWQEMLTDVSDFAPNIDVIELGTGREEISIQELGNYQNIIWNASTGGALADVIRWLDPFRFVSGRVTPNVLAMYMRAGGHVLLCGDRVMSMVINEQLASGSFVAAYPIIFRYELGGQDGRYVDQDIGVRGIGEDSFAYDEFCLNVLDAAYTNPN